MEWMEVAEKNFLIFQGDNMDVAHVMPKKFANKGVVLVFLKKEPKILTEEIDSEVTFFEMGNNPLEHLEIMCEAYLPIISNPLNQVYCSVCLRLL
jgi:hypothetical protein